VRSDEEQQVIQPLIHEHLTGLMVKHYKLQPEPAAEAAMRFMEILELHRMEIVMAEWTVPEPIPVAAPHRRMTTWEELALDIKSVEASGREPWLAREIQ